MITERRQSPNHSSRGGWKPDMICFHITEGSYAGAVNWLCNSASEASAHFVIAQDGRIAQLVDLKESAWTQGTSTDPNSKVFYGKSTLEVVRSRKTNANYYMIGIETEGVWSKTKGKLTDKQLEAAVWLVKYIKEEVKRIFGVDIPIDRDHIVGHYQVAPITKPNCPGPAFQFDEIIARANGKTEHEPAPAADPDPGVTFKVGDMVTVKKTATYYATGQRIADFVKGNTYPVKQVDNNGKRLMLDKIISWVRMEDVILDGKASEPDLAPVLCVGAVVKITGTKYATGQTIPGWVKNMTHVVSQINGEKVLLGANGGICSWVYAKDLTVVK